MSDTTIVKLSLAELREIWTLGFDSGRVYGKKGASFDDETPIFMSDVNRMKSYNKNLALRIERGLTKRAPDAGDSTASRSRVHASAKSKSRKVAKRTQRG